jgi:hypothetical protein
MRWYMPQVWYVNTLVLLLYDCSNIVHDAEPALTRGVKSDLAKGIYPSQIGIFCRLAPSPKVPSLKAGVFRGLQNFQTVFLR